MTFFHAVLLLEPHDEMVSVGAGRATGAGQRLRDLAQAYADRAVEIDVVTRPGLSPAVEILQYADECRPDLIVLGTHGHRGFRRLVLGSVAEEVVRHARCPVLTLRESEDGARPSVPESILVPVDFSESGEVGLDLARELAKDFDASLELLHVVEVYAYPTFYGPVISAEASAKMAQIGRERLVELAEDLRADGIRVECVVRSGRAASEILDFAMKDGSDLIVIASHGLTGLDRMLIGSTAAEVVRSAEMPVLVVNALSRDVARRKAS